MERYIYDVRSGRANTIGLMLKSCETWGAEEGVWRTWGARFPPGTPGGDAPDLCSCVALLYGFYVMGHLLSISCWVFRRIWWLVALGGQALAGGLVTLRQALPRADRGWESGSLRERGV